MFSCFARSASPPRMTVRSLGSCAPSRAPEFAVRWKAEVAQTSAVTSFAASSFTSRGGNMNSRLSSMWQLAPHLSVR